MEILNRWRLDMIPGEPGWRSPPTQHGGCARCYRRPRTQRPRHRVRLSFDQANLAVSLNPNRSGAVRLDGSMVKGKIYVFVENSGTLDKVDFYLDSRSAEEVTRPYRDRATF